MVAIAPAMYRQTLALTLRKHRPGAEVRTADPEDLDREVSLFEPDLIVCHETTSGVRERVFSRVEILYNDGLDAISSVAGRDSRIDNIKIEDLLAILDESKRLVSGG